MFIAFIMDEHRVGAHGVSLGGAEHSLAGPFQI
jgi:hypothetical protein